MSETVQGRDLVESKEEEDSSSSPLETYKKGWKIFFYVLVAVLIVTFVIVVSVLFTYYADVYNASAPVAVNEVDLYRYGGTWYEIARLPISGENGCFNVTVNYLLQPNGTFAVTQNCVSGGSVYSFSGVLSTNAPVTITPTQALVRPGQFNISFGSSSSDYLVLGLDQVNYEWAMYGTRDRSFLKILSRQKTLAPLLYQDLVETARKFNYPTQYLIQTVQT